MFREFINEIKVIHAKPERQHFGLRLPKEINKFCKVKSREKYFSQVF
jgi:hypothetical protein